MSGVQTVMRSSAVPEDEDNIVDTEQSPGRHGNTAGSRDRSQQYIVVHSGQASKVDTAAHPDLRALLPDHVPPEAYIFTDDRSHAWLTSVVQ